MRYILGISAFYHDSAAALLDNGDIVAAAQEERFTRVKNDHGFPALAVEYCLKRAGIRADQLSAVVFYDKPVLKFARMLETFLAIAPRGMKGFVKAVPAWLAEKLNIEATVRARVEGLGVECPVLFAGHHQAHAASAFYPSPFENAAILTVDGVGEYATTTLGVGAGHALELLQEVRFPHSLGLLYSAFTAYCGFRVNSGEYKLMGLAPYGEPTHAGVILEELVDLEEDGSFRLNLDYFDFLEGERMTSDRFHARFGGPPRSPEAPLERRHMDLARSVQAVTETVLLRLARHARAVTGQQNLCLAGGVALNCVANGLLHRERVFERLWVQPAAGDAGGALGAALLAHHEAAAAAGAPVPPRGVGGDRMHGALLGPEFSSAEIRAALDACGAVYEVLGEAELVERVAGLLAAERVVGWFQGRMEFGPRALGNRSILGDARSARMQSVMNLKVKFRESFRPFAPAVLEERAGAYFDLDCPSPYMLLVAPVREALRVGEAVPGRGLESIREVRSSIPAVTHVDYSARVQTVPPGVNPLFRLLLERFEALTGCGLLVNTSFNVRGEPVVCTPDDAYRCFMNTEMDYLVVGPFVVDRLRQPAGRVDRRVKPQED